MIKTSELVSENEAKERILKLLERVENKADFAEVARLQSEDTSATKGGDLGWLSPGDTVPEFERAMDASNAASAAEIRRLRECVSHSLPRVGRIANSGTYAELVAEVASLENCVRMDPASSQVRVSCGRMTDLLDRLRIELMQT